MGKISFRNVRKIVLFGGGETLACACGLIRESGLSLLVVSSQRHLSDPVEDSAPLSRFLKEREIPYLDCSDTKKLDFERDFGSDVVGVSIGAPWIFGRRIISHFEGRLLNLHSTPLPLYRGGASYSWMVLQGDRRGASVLHQVSPRIDAGEIALCVEYEYPECCVTPRDYSDYSREQDIRLMQKLITVCSEGGSLSTRAQDESHATYFPRLATDIHGYIDWSWTACDIARFAAAFDEPYAGASTFLGANRVRFKQCEYVREQVFHPFQAGLVFRISAGALLVATREGAVRVGMVLDTSGADITSSVALGSRFHTPHALLDRALAVTVSYTPDGLKVTENEL